MCIHIFVQVCSLCFGCLILLSWSCVSISYETHIYIKTSYIKTHHVILCTAWTLVAAWLHRKSMHGWKCLNLNKKFVFYLRIYEKNHIGTRKKNSHTPYLRSLWTLLASLQLTSVQWWNSFLGWIYKTNSINWPNLHIWPVHC